MSFPWAAKANIRTVRRRAHASSAPCPRRNSLTLLVLVAVSTTAFFIDSPVARAEPPRTELPRAATQFVTPGSGSAALPQMNGNAMTITQNSPKVILNWQSFNIGRDASVTFNQPDSSSSALNRIAQGSPSQIFGRLSANGQIYLLNQNGLIFGNSALVDTHALVASTLNISDAKFLNGLTNAINQTQDNAAFVADSTMDPQASIAVQSGAVLKTDEGGRIMILAPRVENAGEIDTPGGQAILAASQDKVYLAASGDPNLRGLLVEVKTGGAVDNLGKIVAERGNVTLLGLAVNQDGIVRATTSVNLNGSIRLVAQDQASVTVSSDGVGSAQATHTGSLSLGESSLTEVTADDFSQTAADAQAQPLSQVTMVGNTVTLKSGAQIVAPAGNVQIAATDRPNNPGPALDNPPDPTNIKFVMESGSRVDVSGLSSAVVPMERNVVAPELLGNELRDSPLQRNGPLYGQTVYVDIRQHGTNADGSAWQGTPLADVSGQIAAIKRPLAERLSTGGSVSVVSEGGVMMNPGSTINVSGGAVTYQAGYVNTTQLITSQGGIVDIGSADKNQLYQGIFGTYAVKHQKWGVTEVFNALGSRGSSRFEPGYVEGKDAGTVAINAALSPQDLQGSLLGGVTTDRYQRLAPTADLTGFARAYDQVPLGGQLVLGASGYSGLDEFTLNALTDLGADGMNRWRIYANGKITVPETANLVFAPGGVLTLATNGNVDVQGRITAPGGNVQITALGNALPAGTPAATLEAIGRIDVSGQWINDGVALNPGAAPQGPAFINGGSVAITASGDLALEAGTLIDASGGAQLQRNGKVQNGKGGQISIADKPSSSHATDRVSSLLSLDGELRAYSFSKGGSLSLTGAGFRVGGSGNDAPPNTVYLSPDFFEHGGFAAYNLTATHTGITIAPNTNVRLQAINRVLNPNFNLLASGTNLAQLGSPGLLPDYQQQSVSLGLTLARATSVPNTVQVEMESGSSIQAKPGASVALTSDSNLIVDGTVSAPAGNIQLNLSAPTNLPVGTVPPPQAIWLGPQGQLLAGAFYRPVPDSAGRGLRLGTVRDGGTVNVNAATAGTAQRGYFIADPGSRIDVSGITQTLDVAQGSSVTPTAVNGAAGSINLTAVQGMALNGELVGARGRDAGGAGGNLNITLGNNQNPGGAIALSAVTTVTAPAIGDISQLSALNGMAEIGTDTIAAGGFDGLSLHSLGTNTDPTKLAQIELKGDVNIAIRGSLVLDAPVLSSDGGDSVLSAGYLALGSRNQFNLFNVDPTLGDGSLLLHGQHVDLIGTLALRGFGPGAATTAPPVRIESDGDIRLIGGNQQDGSQVNQVYTDGFYSVGRLNSAADLDLRANQVYTATATDFTVSVSGSGGKIAIQRGGASDAPLSAGSKLTLAADNIEQNGTLLAPFGQIELDAKNSLVLGGGSVTSVSGAGQLVPFGKTEFGQDWLYPLSNGSSVINGIYTAPPDKRISLNGSRVTLAPGSVVDVAGGGDLLATEQQPGTGGSFDILLDPAHVNGAFAIMPARQDLYGSYDPYYSSVSGVKPGNTIYIAAGAAVPAGEYAMLPAGYALLPGAYLITPLLATSSPIPGQAVQQYDGSAIVAAQLGVAGTGVRSNLWSAYLVQNGAQVRSRAEYLESHADTFFAATADRLNQDAGQLVIDAQTALALGGTLANNSAGGRGSEVDILADNLAVVTSYTGATDRVELLDSGLNELNADSLLLGGTRQQHSTDVALNVQAKDVTVDSGTSLSGPEVMLAATDHVTVESGATITAADGNRARAPTSIDLTGDSALARISSADQVQVQRAPGNAAVGTLDIAAGAVLDASRSITLDASQNTVVDGDMRTHDGGSLSLASSRISLGEAPAGTGGLVLSNDRLSRLEASDLRLNSRGSIDFYGQVALSNLNAVALNAAGIGGYANAGQNVSISAADTISLSNRSNVVFTGTPDGNGALNLSARQVTLGEGSFAVRGFANTMISATGQIIAAPAADTPVELHVAGELALQSARITASKGADASIDTQDASNNVVGKMTLTGPAILPNPVTDLGAKLELTATEIDDGAHIELPSGIVNLHATGAGGVNIAANASIDVSGRDLTFADTTAGSPGGNVSLTADQGNVTIGASAHIDVSGARSGGDAGTLSISATAGAVQLNTAGQLAGAGNAGDRAGSFALDTGTLTNDFPTLNDALFTGGFTDSLQFRLRTGDLAIGTANASNVTVQAHSIQLEADAGKIDVYGRLDASGNVSRPQAGQVALYARDDVSLHGGSSISATAAGTDENGGSVTLASTAGRLDVQAGASIDVAGTDATGARADSGTVYMRATRDGSSGVLVNAIYPAGIRGAANVNIEAYRTYTASNVDAALINTIQSDTGTYMNNASAGNINNTLGIGSDTRFHLLPGVEIDSTGDLALNAPWDLLHWRYNGNAGVLTLRTAGNLNINQNLSDGVATVSDSLLGTSRITAATPAGQPNQGNWSYRLTAGADLSGADPMAVNQGVGNVTLASGVKVRSGTGNVVVAAGNNLTLTDSTAAIYTVGANRGPGGVPDASSLSLSADQVQEIVYNGDFLRNGGDIRIAVGANVQGANGHQVVNDWLARAGGDIDLFGEPISLPASWAVNIGNFQQNIGALGGGNVTVTAGGNVDNLSAVIPTTGQPVAGSNPPSIAGGGDLRIQAGGDIRGGVYYLGKGQANLQAGGSITAGDNSLYPVLALGDGQYSMRARKDLTIESIVNPTVLPISAMQGAIDPNSGQPFQAPLATYFFTYTPDSAAKLEAVSGDVTVRADTTAMRAVFSTLNADTVPLSYLPGTLSARSLEGDVVVSGAGFTLVPASLGNLELLAQGSIVPATDNLSIVLSDADPAQLPSVQLPASDLVDAEKRLNPGVLTHAPSPVHLGDPKAANIVARTGDIGSPPGSRNQLNLTLAKQTRLYAGGDVRNLKLRVQNVNAGDISVVEAGGSVTFPTLRDPSGKVAVINNANPFVLNGPGFEVAGPGQFYVIAGKNVDFGTSQGVISVGNLQNPALAAHGADITVMAGQAQAPDYGNFIQRYLVDEDTYHDALAQYMTALGLSDSSVDAFRALPLVQQRKFILQVLFEELRASGAAASTSKNYDRGFAAINTLFPAASYPGDIKSFLSRIETADGGDIKLVAPGGLVNAGVAGSAVVNKPPVQLGVVALQDGNINALAHGGFLVNQSRVFALDGGDILIWSSTGNIDAGKGAKTALSIPPAQASTDPYTGITTVEFPPPIQGSGIGAAVRTPGKKPGDVFLIAPVGVVNAGDAGISSAGNLTIAATAVLGASNIQVAGASIGVPVADTGGLGAGLIGVSNVASSVTKSTDDTVKGLTDNTDSDLSFLDVQVTGFGGDQGGEVVNLRKRKKEP